MDSNTAQELLDKAEKKYGLAVADLVFSKAIPFIKAMAPEGTEVTVDVFWSCLDLAYQELRMDKII